jgi:hypothetical protein
MWKVKRMNPGRLAVLAVAVVAGGTAAYLASGSEPKPAPQAIAQMQTVNVLVAKNEIGHGQPVKPDDRHWQIESEIIRSNLGVLAIDHDEDGQQRARRGKSVKLVRDGVVSTTTVQK